MNKLALLGVAILLWTAQPAIAQTAAPLKLATKYEIPTSVKGRFDHLGIDTAGNRLFVVAEEGGQVLVFDLGSGKIVHTIMVPHPHAVLVRNDLNRIYITDEEKGAVNIYDAKTYEMQKAASWPVKLGKDNSTMAFDESTHRLFVGCRSGQMVVFDTQAGKELQALAIGKGTDDLMFDPASKRIYATSGGAGMVNVYKETDPDHYQSLGQVPSGPGGKTGLLAPQLSRLFVPVPGKGATPSAVYVYELQ